MFFNIFQIAQKSIRYCQGAAHQHLGLDLHNLYDHLLSYLNTAQIIMVLSRILQIIEICQTTPKIRALHHLHTWDIPDSSIHKIMLWINAWLVTVTL